MLPARLSCQRQDQGPSHLLSAGGRSVHTRRREGYPATPSNTLDPNDRTQLGPERALAALRRAHLADLLEFQRDASWGKLRTHPPRCAKPLIHNDEHRPAPCCFYLAVSPDQPSPRPSPTPEPVSGTPPTALRCPESGRSGEGD